MNLKVFYQGDGPEMRYAKDKARELESEGYRVEYLDWDDRLTIHQAELYSVMTTPAFLIVQDDGKMVELWQGDLPSVTETKNLMMR